MFNLGLNFDKFSAVFDSIPFIFVFLQLDLYYKISSSNLNS